MDLLQAFKSAADNDPLYQIQLAQYKEQVQQVPLKFANILPQVNLSAQIDKLFQTSDFYTNGYFTTKNYVLNATQTLFNFTQYKELEQAGYVVRAAFLTLSGQQQELMRRTANAYFEVLKNEELVKFTKQQLHYLEEQVEATQTLFDHNHATIVNLEQAKGARDLIQAELYTTKINLYNSKQTLSEITCVSYDKFAHVKKDYPLIQPEPKNIDAWVKIADKQNFFLRASRQSILAAREAMFARQGGFLPDLQGEAQLNELISPNTPLTGTEKQLLNFIGINANWNVLAGGRTVAEIRAASANLQRAHAEMRRVYLNTMAETRRSYTDIILGKPRVENIRKALASNYRALKSAQEAYRAGDLTITEILQIQGQLFSAQRQYAEDNYKFLIDILDLKLAAGILDIESLAQLNSWLVK